MSITELKAQAYDVLANIEFLQGKLREINAQIAKIANEPKADVAAEPIQ